MPNPEQVFGESDLRILKTFMFDIKKLYAVPFPQFQNMKVTIKIITSHSKLLSTL